jgi:hypothetical protein
MATSGVVWVNSLATTVATPTKWPGRAIPSRRSETAPTVTVVENPAGYMTSTVGT